MAKVQDTNDASRSLKSALPASSSSGGLPVGTPSAVQGRPKADEETVANVIMTIEKPELKSYLRGLRRALQAGTWEDVVSYLQTRDGQVVKLEAKVVELEKANKSLMEKFQEKIFKIASDYVHEIDDIVNPPKQPEGDTSA